MMKQPIVINFTPEGIVQGMHRDEFNLGFLGKQTIVRASDIRFNPDTQHWRIHVNTQPELGEGHEEYHWVVSTGEFDSYEKARDFEVLWLNTCRMEGVPVSSIDSAAIAVRVLSESGLEKAEAASDALRQTYLAE